MNILSFVRGMIDETFERKAAMFLNRVGLEGNPSSFKKPLRSSPEPSSNRARKGEPWHAVAKGSP